MCYSLTWFDRNQFIINFALQVNDGTVGLYLFDNIDWLKGLPSKDTLLTCLGKFYETDKTFASNLCQWDKLGHVFYKGFPWSFL